MVDPTDTPSRTALARDNLTAKLGELRRREAHVRAVLSPARYLANPWLYAGIAAIVGYRLGRRDPGHPAIETVPACHETMVHAVVRASLIAIAQALTRRAMTRIADDL